MSADALAAALEGLTERQQRNIQIARGLCNSVAEQIERNIKLFPDDWDGMEVREVLSKLFERERYDMGLARKRRFNREWLNIYLK
jgi:hypothetical protein